LRWNWGRRERESAALRQYIRKAGSAAAEAENRCERVEPLDAAFINNIMITSKMASMATKGARRAILRDFPTSNGVF
jgi:hypothetical protein